jgi:hypothetical protein
VILPEGCLHGKVQYDSRIEIDEGEKKNAKISALQKRWVRGKLIVKSMLVSCNIFL